VHLVGFIICMYHDVRSAERQSKCKLTISSEMRVFVTVEKPTSSKLSEKEYK